MVKSVRPGTAEAARAVKLAREHVANCQSFFYRVRLLQVLQIEILRPIVESASPFGEFWESMARGEFDRLYRHDSVYRAWVLGDEAKKVTSPGAELLAYVDLRQLRNNEAYVDCIQRIQASIVGHCRRTQYWHAFLLELAGHADVPDDALDEPTREKFMEWMGECRSIIDYYRAWRDAEVPFIEQFIERATRLDRARMRRGDDDAASKPEQVLAPPDETSVEVLRLLAKYKTTFKVTDIAGTLGRDRKTVGPRLRDLSGLGYVRLRSARRGYFITDRGRAFLAEYREAATAR
jgi:DNA-binding transcriptional ArsR family regulator